MSVLDDKIDNVPSYGIICWLFSIHMKRITMKMKRIISLLMVVVVIPMLSGCWYVVAGGAGAYGGFSYLKL